MSLMAETMFSRMIRMDFLSYALFLCVSFSIVIPSLEIKPRQISPKLGKDSGTSHLFSVELKGLLNSRLKNKTSAKAIGFQNIQRVHMGTLTKMMVKAGYHEQGGSARTHQQTAENYNNKEEGLKMNFIDTSQEPIGDQMRTNLLSNSKESSLHSDVVNGGDKKLLGHIMEATWNPVIPRNAALQNEKALPSKTSSTQKPNGNAPVPLKIQLLPIPVVQTQNFPAHNIKILHSLFGTLRMSKSSGVGKKQPTRNLEQFSSNNFQQPILNTPHGTGNSDQLKLHSSGITPKGQPPAAKCSSGNSTCIHRLHPTSQISIPSSNSTQATKKSEDIAQKLPPNNISSSTSRSQGNDSQFVPSAHITKNIRVGQLTTHDEASPYGGRNRKGLVLQKKLKIKPTSVTTLTKKENIRQGSRTLPVTLPKTANKPIKNHTIMRERIRHHSSGYRKAFTKANTALGTPAPIWVQQGSMSSDALMMADLHGKHDSVTSPKPDVYGPCRDYDPRCPMLVKFGWCNSPLSLTDEINIRDYCVVSCGFCDGGQTKDKSIELEDDVMNKEDAGFPEYSHKFDK